MSLIKSISGIRGTIGGRTGNNLTPVDIVESAAAYGTMLQKETSQTKVVVGRDARISGPWVQELCTLTLRAMGIDVVDCGLSTTPTIEMAIVEHSAQGGIILTASHNPKQWNALKLLNKKGEFISAEQGEEMLEIARRKDFKFAEVDAIGEIQQDALAIDKHISKILDLDLVQTEKIKAKKFKVVVDCINSTGSLSIVPLLEKLNCEVTALNDDLSGDFAHNPEPLPAHLEEIMQEVADSDCDLGIVVDPDVDRLAFIDEKGSFFGEEYTLVAVADYILQRKKGAAVSNLSSSIALQDVCEKHGVDYHSSAVGEVNVVAKMKEVEAIIGGEGNGGVILPALHFGRDALAGVALFLSFVAETGKSVSDLRSTYKDYFMVKDKMSVADIDLDKVINQLKKKYSHLRQDDVDGLKIYFDEGWIHLRKSNTEPILRVYSETETESGARKLVAGIKKAIAELN